MEEVMMKGDSTKAVIRNKVNQQIISDNIGLTTWNVTSLIGKK